MNETKEQFEARFAKYMPSAVFGENRVAMPCTCKEGGGPTHWVAIANTPESIRDHRELEKCLTELRKCANEERS